MGIKVLPPDVNESIGYFAAVGDDIRFGLGAVRNVGCERRRRDPSRRARRRARSRRSTTSCARCPLQVANKRTVESLIKAGAFDSLGSTRRALMEIHEEAVERAVQDQARRGERRRSGSTSTASGTSREPPVATVPDRPEWAKRDKLAFEREMLGLYVSDHPLAGLEMPLAKHASITIPELLASETSQRRRAPSPSPGSSRACSTASRATRGNQYGMMQVEDFGGEITVMFMGKTYQEFSPALVGRLDRRRARPRVSMRDDGMNLHAFSMFSPELGQGDELGPLVISVAETARPPRSSRRSTTCSSGTGATTRCGCGSCAGAPRACSSCRTRCAVTADLYGELKSLLGPNCLV